MLWTSDGTGTYKSVTIQASLQKRSARVQSPGLLVWHQCQPVRRPAKISANPCALALLEAPDSVNTPRLPTLWEEPQLLPFDREGGAHPPYATKITHTFRIRAISNKPVQNWHTDARVKVRKLHVSVSGYELIGTQQVLSSELIA